MENVRRLVFFLFFVSGISGLMYQVVWVRMYSRIIGSTNYAIAIVLAAFMGGLAAGSFLFGKTIDRRVHRLRFFALLELSIGIVSLAVTFAIPLFGPFYKHIYQLSGDTLGLAFFIRASLLFLCVLIPATLMGGTLPVLTSYLTHRYSAFSRNVSLLYGLNTIGAVFGVLFSGYVSIGFWGERRTVLLGFLLNAIVATGAFLLHYRSAGRPVTVSPPEPGAARMSTYSNNVRGAVLAAIFLSGLTALAYEVIWSRQLILYLKTSIYAFSAMLATFLAGVGLGSTFITLSVKRIKNPLYVLGAIEIVIGLLSVINVYTFPLFDNSHLLDKFGPALAAVAIVFPLTLFFGAAFPVATMAFTKDERTSGSSVGTLYSFNTMGNIIGSLVGGFILIPVVGSSNSILFLGTVNLLIGTVLVLLDSGKAFRTRIAHLTAIPIACIFSFGLFGNDPFLDVVAKRIQRLAENSNADYRIFSNREGVQGTVTSFSLGGGPFLYINSVSMTILCTDTKLMAHIPVALLSDPKEMLIIAFGMGTTARSASLYEDLNVTTVEIVPEVYGDFSFFHPDADEVVRRKNLKRIVNDGRNYLFLTDKKFDIITLDPSPPIWSAGTVNLYSREFFQLCKEHLTEKGIMNLWFPGDATEDEMKAVLKAFHSVFPRTTVWSGIKGWGFYFIGMPENLQLDPDSLKEIFRNPITKNDVMEYAAFDTVPKNAFDILELLMWNADEVARQVKDFPMVTDDYPYTEFPLWRHSLEEYEKWRPDAQLKYADQLFRKKYYWK